MMLKREVKKSRLILISTILFLGLSVFLIVDGITQSESWRERAITNLKGCEQIDYSHLQMVKSDCLIQTYGMQQYESEYSLMFWFGSLMLTGTILYGLSYMIPYLNKKYFRWSVINDLR